MKIYIIGLESNYRGSLLEDQLKAMNLSFSLIPGVEGTFEGRNVETYADQEGAALTYGHNLRKSEIGCALAHYKTYKSFLETNDEWALVLEDDVTIVDKNALFDLLESLMKRATADPEIISCYARGVIASQSEKISVGKLALHKSLVVPFSATSYFVNRRAAELLVSLILPVISPADWPIRTHGFLKHFIVYPWAVEPRQDTFSTIGIRNQDRKSFTSRAINRVSSLLGFHFIRSGRYYGSLRAYWVHQVGRFAIQRSMGRNYFYLVSKNEALPKLSPFLETLCKVLKF